MEKALTLLAVVLLSMASAGCGPQEKEPAPETPTGEPGTAPESQPTVQENPAGEQQEVSAQMPPEWLPKPQNLNDPARKEQQPRSPTRPEWVPVPSNMGKASARR